MDWRGGVLMLTEIDDIQIGQIVYVPTSSGFLHSPGGRTTKWKPYTVDRHYKRGYEDRVTVVSPTGGERRIRHRGDRWLAEDDDPSFPVTAQPMRDRTFSTFTELFN
jgi:hypothetical protein